MSDAMTQAEHRAIELTAELTRLVCAQVIGDGPTRQADIAEFVRYVHQIQNMILSQAAGRAYPDLYRLLGRSVG